MFINDFNNLNNLCLLLHTNNKYSDTYKLLLNFFCWTRTFWK